MASGSVLHEVSGERLVVLGWAPAMLMQFAHPLIAAGVGGHSTFKGRVSDAAVRLHHTVAAMLSLTFGTDTERQAALSRIRAIHRTVHGALSAPAGPFPVGTTYSAEDPALLLWVHLTLLDRTADVYQRLRRPLSSDDLDTLCDQSAPLLIELGGDAAAVPRTWAMLRAQIEEARVSGVLTVTPLAHTIGSAVLSPRAAGLPVPFAGFHRLLTVGLLPSWLRAAYGLVWNDRREAQFHRALRLVRAARGVMPDRLARWRQARQRR
jgi:uncharacterized protein (DUF2236 family)